VKDEQGGSNLKEVQVYRVPYNEEGCNVQDISGCGEWPLIATVPAPLDSRDWSCTDTQNCSTDSPKEGVYLYGIHVLDNAKNEITETQAGKRPIKVQVDTTRPTIGKFERTNPPGDDPVNVANRTVIIEYEVADDLSKLQKVELWRKKENEDWGDTWYKKQNISGESKAGSFKDTFSLGVEGTYIYGLHVVDRAGNRVTESEAGRTLKEVKVDTKAPACVVGVSVSYSSAPQPKATLIVGAKGGGLLKDIVGYAWKFGDGQEEDTESNIITHEYAPGTYTVRVEPQDGAGNTFTCSAKVDVDDEKPKIQVFTVEPESVNQANPTVTVTYEITDSGGADLWRVVLWRKPPGQNWALLGGAVHEVSGVAASGEFKDSPIGNGTFAYRIHVIDRAGNERVSSSKSVQVETGPPPVPEPPPVPGGDCNPTDAQACPGVLICVCQEGSTCPPEKGKCEPAPEPGPGVFVNPLRAQTFAALLNTVLNFLFTIALVVAPLTILAAAFMFVTGGGNPEQVSRAKKTMIWTVVGLIVIILSKGIVTVIQNFLV